MAATETSKGILFYLLLTLVSLMAAGSVATQHIAQSFSYSNKLGSPLFNEFYAPLSGIKWSLQIYEYLPSLVYGAWLKGALTGLLTGIVGLVAFRTCTTRREKMDSHGTARWATRDEIVAANLLENNANSSSVIVGGFVSKEKWGRSPKTEYLIHTGPESVLLFAPSRSGKGVALVVPNLLSYSSSALILDVKGELWGLTAGYRKTILDNSVMYHDPSSNHQGNARFNPLQEIRIDSDFAVKDTQMLCEFLIPTNPKQGGTDHFDKAARSLLVGIILFECYKAFAEDRHTNIASVLSAISDPENPFPDYLQQMYDYDAPYSNTSVVVETATDMLNREQRELSSIVSSVTTPLAKFRDPILADATSESDFMIMDLVEHEKPLSLYLTIRPADRERLDFYFGMIVNLVCRRLTETLPGRVGRRELLLMLDEFSSLPPLPVVQQSLDIFAGYLIKAFIVLQDAETLKALYGNNETITSNCKISIAYTPKKLETAEMLSKLIGTKTVRQKTINKSGNGMTGAPTSRSDNESFHSRSLMTTDEVMRLPIPLLDAEDRMIKEGAALIFTRGCYPISGVQTPFFFDRNMLQRIEYAAPKESDQLMESNVGELEMAYG